MRVYQSAVGTLHPSQVTQVGSQVSGRVDEVYVDVGDKVTKDQALARLDQKQFQIQVQQAKAELDDAASSYSAAEKDFERMKNLWESPKGDEPSIARKRYDDAIREFEKSAARKLSAEQSVALAEYRLAETVILAPYDGVITLRFVHPGQSVTAAPPTHLFEIQDTSNVYLEFSLPQSHLASIATHAGPSQPTPVEFWVDGMEGTKHTGVVNMVFPSVDQETHSFKCRVVVANSAGVFRPGLLAEVLVQLDILEDVILVPAAAVRLASDGGEVTILAPEGETKRKVKLGRRNTDNYEVLDGLRVGEQVLLRPAP